MYCKYLSRKLNNALKCNFYKKNIITLDCCKNCSNFIVVQNKGINKVSNKRIFVKKEIYDKVFERDKGKCRLCGNSQIQLHHIIYRSENKNLINEPSNCIMLCTRCHKLVHSNKHLWQPKLKKIVGGIRNGK